MSDGAARWQRLQDIVQAALDRPADARVAFLDDACGGDESLRREAASLVEQDDRADGFLATPLAALAAGAATYSPGDTSSIDHSRDLTGARLGAYEIRARLGAGGMGEVYRAHDHSLHRDVAIKVLPLAFATDVERLARFEREARLLASLNHPHIGAVYGLAGDSNLRGIVLELIEGETLEARLVKGPIPVAQALSLAQQIARALDHAHQHGVTHRDLKPANIMLTKSGAKLLDFGLAKWGVPRSGYSPSSGSASARPEGVESVTSEGAILGTLHYMAPEQLEGKRVDARADVFAFGAVLYEMLAGRRAFDGGSAAAVMASVLNTQPSELGTIQRIVSPALERVVRKCLAKDPDDRWQTARDLADELSWVSSQMAPTAAAASRSVVPSRRSSARLMFAVAAITSVIAGGTGWLVARSRVSTPAKAITSFTLLPAAGNDIGDFTISPDGALMAYISGPKRQILVRRLDQFTAVPIAGAEEADSLFFSPDGNWVAYNFKNRLMKVKVDGTAAPVSICELAKVENITGASWHTDGTIVFGTIGEGLSRVSAEGGEPASLTKRTGTPRDEDHHNPSFLPGGRVVLFTLHDAKDRFHVAVENLDSSERRVLIEGGYGALFVTSGHLVFGKENAVWAVPFDLNRLTVTGPAVSLVEGVQGDPTSGGGGFRLSADGTLVFRPMTNIDGRTLTWVNRSGTEEPIAIRPQPYTSPSVSPDGGKVAFAVTASGRRDIWTYELATERLNRLTSEGDNRVPIWTRDGLRLTYSSMFDDPARLVWQLADGSAPPEQLSTGTGELVAGAWSSGNHELYYVDDGISFDKQLGILVSKGEAMSKRRIDGKGEQRHPSLSPDGRWLAYTSYETGRPEVYVSGVPAMTTHHQVSTEGGRQPKWSRDGRELVYRSGGRVFATAVDTTRGFSAGKPHLLFERNYVVGGIDTMGHDYDLAPDGRLLMIKPGAEEQAPTGVRVVLNWVDELARRVPNTQ